MILPELARLVSVVALLLSFGLLAGGRLRPLFYGIQCAAVAVVALCGLWVQGDAALLVVAVVATGLGWGVPWLLQRIGPAELPAPFPVLVVCTGLLLVVVSAVAVQPDGLAVPLSIVLLGVLAIAAAKAPVGARLGGLSLANGVILAMIAMPGLPLRAPIAVLLPVLALLAVFAEATVWRTIVGPRA
jgi:hydrogenase-4 component E